MPHDQAHEHLHEPQQGSIVADASVRIARVSDAPAVGLVQAAVWREAYADVLPEEVLHQFEGPAFARVWRDSLASVPTPRHRLLVACAGEQVVGFVAVGPSADPDSAGTSGEVLAMGVHPEARGAGHGSRLLNAAVDTLRGGGFERMVIWLLQEDEGGREFLLASGLAPDGAWRDRVVDADGGTVREVRLVADLGAP